MAVPQILSEVPDATPYIQYVATNGQTVFPYPFPITQDSDLVVAVNGVTLGTDAGYALSGQGNDTGGNVTFTAGQTGGAVITLFRDIAIERVSQISQNSGFSSTVFNAEYNNIYLILQQLAASIAQSLQIPNTNNPAPITTLLPSSYAGKYLTFDGNGNPQPGVLTSSGSLTASIMAALLNIYTTTAITPAYVRSAAEIAASVIPTNYAYLPGDVRRYGADPTGVADSSTAFASALSVKGVVTAVGSFLINSGLTLDISSTTLVGPCILTSGLAASAGALLTVDASVGAESNAHNKISQVYFNGSGLTGVQAVHFSGNNNVACFGVENCTFYDFADGVYIDNNTFEVEFNSCAFSHCGSDHAAVYSHFGSSERVSLVQCQLFNNTECVRVDGGGEVFLSNCSLDYSNRIYNAISGTISADNCFIENNLDTDYWFKCSAGSLIAIHGGMIAQTGSKTSYNWGYCTAGSSGQGIFIDHTQMYCSNNTTPYPLIAGYGAAFGEKNLIAGFSDNGYAWPIFSYSQEYGGNGGFFYGGSQVGGWTLGHSGSGGTASVTALFSCTGSAAAGVFTAASSSGTLLVGDTISGANVPPNTVVLSEGTGTGGNGTYNISYQGTIASASVYCYGLALTTANSGDHQFATYSIAAVPGDNVGVMCKLATSNTANAVSIALQAIDINSNVLTTSDVLNGYNAFDGNSYKSPAGFPVASCFIPRCPAGTVSVLFTISGGTNTSYTAYIKDVHIGKY